MTRRQQAHKQKHRGQNPWPHRSNQGTARVQSAHPVRALQSKVGNACIARMLKHTGDSIVQRAAYAKFPGIHGESLDEDHKRWVTLGLADAISKGATHATSQGESVSTENPAFDDVHRWANALGMTEWEL